jgi:hypothetical protein
VNEDEFRKGPAVTGSSSVQRRHGPGRPFVKGQSGNPSGRSPVVKAVQELAREHGPRAIQAILNLAETSQDDKVRLAAWDKILDRAYGRPAQAITGEGGEGPAVIVVETGVTRDAAADPED